MEACLKAVRNQTPGQCKECEFELLPEHQREFTCKEQCGEGYKAKWLGGIARDHLLSELEVLHLRGLGGEDLSWLDRPWTVALGRLRQFKIEQAVSSVVGMFAGGSKSGKGDKLTN